MDCYLQNVCNEGRGLKEWNLLDRWKQPFNSFYIHPLINVTVDLCLLDFGFYWPPALYVDSYCIKLCIPIICSTLSGAYKAEPCIRPPSCTTPRQQTIYECSLNHSIGFMNWFSLGLVILLFSNFFSIFSISILAVGNLKQVFCCISFFQGNTSRSLCLLKK